MVLTDSKMDESTRNPGMIGLKGFEVNLCSQLWFTMITLSIESLGEQVWGNRVDPDQMLQKVAYDHCLLICHGFLKTMCVIGF